jgi:hypothetical protein
MQPRLRKIRK